MNIELSKSDLVTLISGLSPTYDVQDDETIKKCGYVSSYVGSSHQRWFWEDKRLNRLTNEELRRVYNVIKGNEPKLILNAEEAAKIAPYRFVRMGDKNTGTALRLTNEGYGVTSAEYYRDAGHWSVEFEWVDGKLMSVSDMESLDGNELFEISRDAYLRDNKGYVRGKV